MFFIFFYSSYIIRKFGSFDCVHVYELCQIPRWKFCSILWFSVVSCFLLQIILILVWLEATSGKSLEHQLQWQGAERDNENNIVSHSCIHDQIIEQRRRPGHKVYSVTPQFYKESDISKPLHRKGRALLGVSSLSELQKDAKQPIRIYLNYDAVGHSPDRDCRRIGDIVKVRVLTLDLYAVYMVFMPVNLMLVSFLCLCFIICL